jgi:hypothetical protein
MREMMRIRVTLARDQVRPAFAFQMLGPAAFRIVDGHSGTVFPEAPHDLRTGIPSALPGIRNNEAEAVAVDGYCRSVLHCLSRRNSAKHALSVKRRQGTFGSSAKAVNPPSPAKSR